MAVFVACIALLSATGASASKAQNVLRHSKHMHAGEHDIEDASGFVKALEFKHRLRVCNAYPYSAAIEIYHGRGSPLTGGDPMPYKACRDFFTPLKAGDKLEFRVGNVNAGTFSVSDLPNNDAVLFLVIHRHDTLSTAVSFESHVFANLLNAQLAIIDTYKGTSKVVPRIMDRSGPGKHPRKEELRFNSVVAVNPGVYELELSGKGGKMEAKHELVALNRESYVVIRAGVEAQQGESFPQELIVYPNSDIKMLQSSAAMAGPVGALCLALALVAVAFA